MSPHSPEFVPTMIFMTPPQTALVSLGTYMLIVKVRNNEVPRSGHYNVQVFVQVTSLVYFSLSEKKQVQDCIRTSTCIIPRVPGRWQK